MRTPTGHTYRSDQKRLALVTGASSGLGKALAELLASHHIPLILTARKEIDASFPVPVEVCTADLNNPIDREKLIALIHARTPDLIINNAGLGLYGDALSHSTEEQLEILEVNANALLHITLEAARALKAKKLAGTIVNISSAASFFSYPTLSVYAASKAFVTNLSQALDAELAPHGIRVLCACPGKIRTDFRNRASKGHPQKPDTFALSPQKAAEYILSQIQQSKPLTIFPWPYRIALTLTQFLPKSLLYNLLRHTLSSRYKP